MSKIKVGVVGLGCRGKMLLEEVILLMPDVYEVVAVSDYYKDRAEDVAALVKEKSGRDVAAETDYKKVVDNPEVEAVVIAASWEMHVEVAVYAMKAGKAVAMEVGGAYDLKECWELVETYEATKTPFMFLENCCFGENELMVLNMVKSGLFGEIVHCEAGYHHDIRDEVSGGEKNRHYRLRNYINRNCENYPTHTIGPLAKALDINHGNRFVSLTSTSTKAVGLNEYIRNHFPEDEKLMNTRFNQGDIVVTVIKTARGEVITHTLDTTLPGISSRGLLVRGSKGMYDTDMKTVMVDNAEIENKDGNVVEYKEKYRHPIWKEFIEKGVQGGHGGMDWLEFEAFADCLKNNKPMPVDVYDAATWMAVSILSEHSILMGSAPVVFPDFTRGKWINKD